MWENKFIVNFWQFHFNHPLIHHDALIIPAHSIFLMPKKYSISNDQTHGAPKKKDI